MLNLNSAIQIMRNINSLKISLISLICLKAAGILRTHAKKCWQLFPSSFHKHFLDSKPFNSCYWTELNRINDLTRPDQRGTPAGEMCMEYNRLGPLRNEVKSSGDYVWNCWDPFSKTNKAFDRGLKTWSSWSAFLMHLNSEK